VETLIHHALVEIPVRFITASQLIGLAAVQCR
jgi:hypothetical protein